MLSTTTKLHVCRLFAWSLALTCVLPETLMAATLSDPPGVVTTLSGTAGVCGSADGIRTVAQFCGPRGIAADKAGNLYVADTGNSTIRKITPAGAVTTLAGTAGIVGGSVDDTGPAAEFFNPRGITTDRDGNLYVADTFNNNIRKITPAGVVTTLAGNFRHFGPSGSVGSADGVGTAALFAGPTGITADRAGNLYVTDTGNNTIRKITLAGVVTTFAGTAGVVGSANGTGSAAQFNHPQGIAADRAGNLYVADTGNQTIRKISAKSVVSTLAGTAQLAGSQDGTGPAAVFNGPTGITTDKAGNLYVTEVINNTIRKITPAGVVTTLAGNVQLFGSAGSADGIGTAALFNAPSGITSDRTGNLYVADTGNDTIRKITIVRIHALKNDDLNDEDGKTNEREIEGGCILCSPFSR
jgi:sugar lactone lactonase YvrE